jgi:D-beta-D-heptose 7-phosphate kinase/D-beta-D-heptose 1-phosphate adenosyltransferase
MNQPQKQYKILLLGDSCYDYYHFGEVKRISPEAPIPIFDHKYTTKKLGMMSNVLENFRTLGVQPDYQTHFFEAKNRYIDIKSRQQLLRVDQKLDEEGIPHIIHEHNDYDTYDAIVISDYDKGFVSYADLRKIQSEFDGPIFIDTKKTQMSEFGDMIVKINHDEFNRAGSNVTDVDNLIVTKGSVNVLWYPPNPDAPRMFFPPKVETHDVCGAGDTFFASLVFEYLRSDGKMEAAIRFAMKASAITVQKIGVYAPTLEEIENDKT